MTDSRLIRVCENVSCVLRLYVKWVEKVVTLSVVLIEWQWGVGRGSVGGVRFIVR
jgi:hypothetical protein